MEFSGGFRRSDLQSRDTTGLLVDCPETAVKRNREVFRRASRLDIEVREMKLEGREGR